MRIGLLWRKNSVSGGSCHIDAKIRASAITPSITLRGQEISLQPSSKWILTGSVMSSPDKIKAIVLTCDRFRAITRHLILKYERVWPDHPFVFQVPYQELRGTATDRVKDHAAPEDIKGTTLHLL